MLRTYAAAIALCCAALEGAAAPAQADNFQLLYAFTGGRHGDHPYASLLKVGGRLYGTTIGDGAFGGGTVFSLDPATGDEKLVYSFGRGHDAAFPYASLLNVGGTLYGTTITGGAFGHGAVFSLSPKTGAEAVVYSFQSGSDGAGPQASLIDVGGTVYGTTTFGGGSTACKYGCGTVFSLNPTTGAETVVYYFQGGSDGAGPGASLINVGGMLYGTTNNGGNTNCYAGCGTVFSLDPTTGTETILHAFRRIGDGAYPSAAGLVAVGGRLFGTTTNGGSTNCTEGCGTVFSMNLTTGVEKVVYPFPGGSDGDSPFAGLIKAGGTLYGTTLFGGAADRGTVFSMNPKTGAETVLYSFQGDGDGDNPYAGVIDVGGTLYGTTGYGAPKNCGGTSCGTVFGLTPSLAAPAAVR